MPLEWLSSQQKKKKHASSYFGSRKTEQAHPTNLKTAARFSVDLFAALCDKDAYCPLNSLAAGELDSLGVLVLVDTSYAIEKLTNAMNALCLGKGDIRSRLVVAHQCLHTLQESDFPQHLKEDWNWIIKQLTNKGPLQGPVGENLQGSVENTMRRIQNRTGVKIAERISKLYWEMSKNEQYS